MHGGGSDVLDVLTAEAISAMGISRVGDLTDLDTIGIPVWFACRPNSRSISVSQGKGLTHRQARISATMEAVEGAIAERPRDLVTRFGSLEEVLRSGAKVVPLEALARCDFAVFDQARERGWVEGISFLTEEPVLAPYELIGLDMRLDIPWDRHCFRMTSQGLAAGPSFEFAAVHAIEELVENDAATRIEMSAASESRMRPIEYRSGGHHDLDYAIAKVRAAGLEPRFFELASSVGVPVVCASLPRVVVSPSGPITRTSGGFASRPDPRQAALAALLEAVQSRLTDIAAARDDIPLVRYRSASAPLAHHHHVPATDFDDMASRRPTARSSENALALLGRKLIERGTGDVYLFHLCATPVHVVRALVPGLMADAAKGSRHPMSKPLLSTASLT